MVDGWAALPSPFLFYWSNPVMMNEFDPVLYSIPENAFLLAELGNPPSVSLRRVPANVNPSAVKEPLDRIYQLVEEEKHNGEAWCGLGPIRAAISAYMSEAEKWASDKRRGRLRFPTMHSFDSRNRPHKSGPGSDSGQVRTYFKPNGERAKFAVELIADLATQWTPDWTSDEVAATSLIVDSEKGRIECPVCNHTESFNPDKRGSQVAARARMSKHLRRATEETERHAELHTFEFGN